MTIRNWALSLLAAAAAMLGFGFATSAVAGPTAGLAPVATGNAAIHKAHYRGRKRYRRRWRHRRRYRRYRRPRLHIYVGPRYYYPRYYYYRPYRYRRYYYPYYYPRRSIRFYF